jgi:hypothetical protein
MEGRNRDRRWDVFDLEIGDEERTIRFFPISFNDEERV